MLILSFWGAIYIPFFVWLPVAMLGIAIHCIQHSQAMLERGVYELAHSFFHCSCVLHKHTCNFLISILEYFLYYGQLNNSRDCMKFNAFFIRAKSVMNGSFPYHSLCHWWFYDQIFLIALRCSKIFNCLKVCSQFTHWYKVWYLIR